MGLLTSCKDELPKNDTPSRQYLVLISYGGHFSYEVAFYRTKEQDDFYLDKHYGIEPPPYGWWRYDDNIEAYSVEDVVAWMELKPGWSCAQKQK